jgi:hypothetical protein
MDDAPLPPDFVTKPKKEESPPPVPEEAPLPPDVTATKIKSEPESEDEEVPVPDGSDDGSDADSDEEADHSDFSDSGEEITHDETNEIKIPSPKPSAENSFGGFSDKSSTGGLFSGISKAAPKHDQPPRHLFGEIPKQPLLPPPEPSARIGREPFRSPSPTRVSSQKNVLFSNKNQSRPEAGSALTSRKASLTQIAQRGGQLRKPSDTARQEHARAQALAQRQQEEEDLSLSDDDEDERLRADLARPVEPVSTLRPILAPSELHGRDSQARHCWYDWTSLPGYQLDGWYIGY